MNICWSYGYSYTDLTMAVESLFKYPNCYKMVINSLTDWSQWTSIITNFASKQYLFGLLDSCTMSDDAVTLPFWEESPIKEDVVDEVWASNDILSAPSGGTISMPAAGKPNGFFYNTPKADITSALAAWGTGTAGSFPTSCLFTY